MLSIIYVLSTLFSGVVVLWYIYHYHSMRSVISVKGPFAFPFLGNIYGLRKRKLILETFDKYFNKYGNIVKLAFGIQPALLVSDYDAIKAVLTSNKVNAKAINYKFLRNWIQNGLLTSSGAKWKHRRHILTPSHHYQILKQFVTTMNNLSETLIAELERTAIKGTLDIYPFISYFALDVICETAMGVALNAQINKHSAYVQSVKTMGQMVATSVFSPVQVLPFIYMFTKRYKTEKHYLKIFHENTHKIIKNRRNKLLSNNNNATENKRKYKDNDKKKCTAFLDILLQSKDENGHFLTDEDIREEVNTFMFAGHDTTTSAICFTLYEISRSKTIQMRILEEQNNIFDGETVKKHAWTYEDLSKMKYLEMVIKESLRMYPSVPLIGRRVTEEFQLNEDITLPPGFDIILDFKALHENEKYFPNPKKFDPSRFENSEMQNKYPFCFVPFSAGARNCIGQKFAMLEMKICISKMVRHFELSPASEWRKPKLAFASTLKSSNGFVLNLRKRHIRE